MALITIIMMIIVPTKSTLMQPSVTVIYKSEICKTDFFKRSCFYSCLKATIYGVAIDSKVFLLALPYS